MSSQGSHEEAHGRYLAALSLTALGIVFGDIGTSPIYALRESFHSANGIDPTQANVLGVLSLILWSLIIVISIKYLTFVMRADNELSSAHGLFRDSPNRVVELGMQVQL